MTQYTVIKEDQAIYIDQIVVLGCDMSGTKEFHAVQYNTDGGGHIEYKNPVSPNIPLDTEEDIKTYTGITLSEFISRRTAQKEE